MTPIEKMYNVMKKPWAMILYALLVIFVYNFLDKPIAIYFHQLDFRKHIYVLNLLTEFGKMSVYIALFTALGLYFHFIKPNKLYETRSWFMLGCIVVTNLVCFIIKIILGRARPELWFSIQAFGFYGFKSSSLYWSFPSGHTTTITGLVGGLGILFPKYFYKILMIAFFIILTRVVLYHHYLSDVMTAFYLSMLVVNAYAHYVSGFLNLNS